VRTPCRTRYTCAASRLLKTIIGFNPVLRSVWLDNHTLIKNYRAKSSSLRPFLKNFYSSRRNSVPVFKCMPNKEFLC
jgi:hypothetical protein